MGKRKHAEHVNHERWLVSWADLLTLLFAFFVVMFASSNTDKKKAAQMAAAMQTAFQPKGVFEAHSATPPLAPGAGTLQTEALPLIVPAEISGTGSGAPETEAQRRAIEEALAPALQQHLVTLRNTDEGLVVSLDSAGFFDSGSADVRDSVEPILTKLAASLPHTSIRVEGHTDNRPIHTAQFRSNWELSTARAAAIAAILMRSSLISPADFVLAGYGEFHPIAGNNTEAGRAANRRVDIVLLRSRTADHRPRPDPGGQVASSFKTSLGKPSSVDPQVRSTLIR